MKMRILVILLLLSGVSALRSEEKSIMAQQAEEAQNLLDKTFSKMNHAWTRMKYHFHTGNEKVKEEAKKNMRADSGKKTDPAAAKGADK